MLPISESVRAEQVCNFVPPHLGIVDEMHITQKARDDMAAPW